MLRRHRKMEYRETRRAPASPLDYTIERMQPTERSDAEQAGKRHGQLRMLMKRLGIIATAATAVAAAGLFAVASDSFTSYAGISVGNNYFAASARDRLESQADKIEHLFGREESAYYTISAIRTNQSVWNAVSAGDRVLESYDNKASKASQETAAREAIDSEFGLHDNTKTSLSDAITKLYPYADALVYNTDVLASQTNKAIAEYYYVTQVAYRTKDNDQCFDVSSTGALQLGGTAEAAIKAGRDIDTKHEILNLSQLRNGNIGSNPRHVSAAQILQNTRNAELIIENLTLIKRGDERVYFGAIGAICRKADFPKVLNQGFRPVAPPYFNADAIEVRAYDSGDLNATAHDALQHMRLMHDIVRPVILVPGVIFSGFILWKVAEGVASIMDAVEDKTEKYKKWRGKKKMGDDDDI